MIPILFPAAETAFTDERRQLSETVSCTVREAEGGYSELTLQYPVIGEWFSELVPDALILARPNPYTRPQPFRIYAASKPMNGLVRFSARHLVYDGRGIPVAPFTASSAADAAQKLKSNAVIDCPFTLTTALSVDKEWKVETPQTLRELIATDEESWRSVYGGELQFDFYTIRLLENPGQDRGVTIAYGVDLVDLQQEENIGNTYTGVLPYWSGTQTVTVPSGDPNTEDEVTQQEVCIRGTVRYASGSFPVQKILPVDFSSWFTEPPTAAQLDALGDEYITAKGVGIPEVSLKIDYAQLGQDVRLYDTIGIRFDRLGVETRARVTGTTFDTLREIYTAVEVGTRPQITDTMTDASRLKTGKLRSSRIANGSIGGRALGSGAVSARALAAYAVTKNKLAALSVGSSKLAAGAVKADKIADNAVTVSKIVNGAVVSIKIEDGAVTGNKILDTAVGLAKLSEDLQVFYADTVAANNIVANLAIVEGDVYTANGHIHNLKCNTLRVNGVQFTKQDASASVMDANTRYTLTAPVEHTGNTSDGKAYKYYTYDNGLSASLDSIQRSITITDILKAVQT